MGLHHLSDVLWLLAGLTFAIALTATAILQLLKELLLIACILLGLVAQSYGASTQHLSVKEAVRQKLLLKHPNPDYPLEARAKLWTGKGVFELTFDEETGLVREVHTATSTGHAVLDDHAIRALKLWKVKPHSLKRIRVPVTFTYHY